MYTFFFQISYLPLIDTWIYSVWFILTSIYIVFFSWREIPFIFQEVIVWMCKGCDSIQQVRSWTNPLSHSSRETAGYTDYLHLDWTIPPWLLTIVIPTVSVWLVWPTQHLEGPQLPFISQQPRAECHTVSTVSAWPLLTWTFSIPPWDTKVSTRKYFLICKLQF